ncbi:sulfite exporter TauE/SafE family protein [Idiomarina sp. HP20-50]|uniref:sulfite exporter TauE/SafE family protein n=1 Tax=Idiomarina sp. HP20-50 TaxID=3070813 RepID=UPI00294AF7CE|nr:sulfite exporter TauE/SafE family protein [Idiomarina sp. HP20-50]MDV6315098.1 sulfite exporter TauE/SafE family protein [Idiomarina sp. HP20-50]
MMNPINQSADLITALLMGLAGAGHCLVMCGGIASAMGVNTRAYHVWLYNLGRVSSYMVIGALVGGAIGLFAPEGGYTTMVLRWLAVSFLLLLGLYFTGWFSGLVYLEKAGRPIWRKVQPLAIKLRNKPNALATFLAGAFWGWLPCGMVYSALSWAALSGSASGGALTMAAFGLGTLPAMIAAGHFSQFLHRFLQAQGVRTAMGVLLIVYALWSLLTLIKPFF